MYVWQKSYNDHLDNAICLCLHHTSREILNTMIVHATDLSPIKEVAGT